MERLRTELVLSAIRLAPRTSSDSVVPSDDPPDRDEASLFTSESRAPMLSLMDNAVLRAQHTIPKARIDGGPWPQPVAAGGPTARLLRALLPSPLDFLEIVQSSRCAWDFWRGVLPIASLPCGD